MLGRSGAAATRFFDRIPRVLYPFADRSFGGLRTVLQGLAGGLRAMLDSLTGFRRGFLDSLASLFDWILFIRLGGKGGAK